VLAHTKRLGPQDSPRAPTFEKSPFSKYNLDKTSEVKRGKTND